MCTATFTAGPVTLTAAPDGTHTFGGWTGACTGTGDCVLGLGAGANAVTATFTVIPGSLTLTPSSQDFGSVTLGAVSSVDFTVKNTGGATSSSISAMVSDVASYTVTGGTCINAQLAPGATCTVTVRFNPTGQAGAKPATLTVTATQGGSPTSSLTGTALTAGALSLSPASKDFGAVAVGGMSTETVFTLTNTGQTATGTLGAPMLSNTMDFMISSNSCPSTLGPSASCSIGARFTPASVGAKTGVSLTVSGAGTASTSLQGTGTAQVTVTNAGGGTVTSSPAGISCGATCSATFSSAPVTLTAAPDASHTFTGWSGACSGTGACSLPLTAATYGVTATFAVPVVTLNLTNSGTLTSNPSGYNCVGPRMCSWSVPSGTYISWTTPTTAKWTETGRTGGIAGTSFGGSWGDNISYDVTFGVGEIVVGVTTGHGHVTSTPAGIDCSSCTRSNAFFPSNQAVTLTATPISPSTVVLWQDHVGNSPCNNSTSTTCTITPNAYYDFSVYFQ